MEPLPLTLDVSAPNTSSPNTPAPNIRLPLLGPTSQPAARSCLPRRCWSAACEPLAGRSRHSRRTRPPRSLPGKPPLLLLVRCDHLRGQSRFLLRPRCWPAACAPQAGPSRHLGTRGLRDYSPRRKPLLLLACDQPRGAFFLRLRRR